MTAVRAIKLADIREEPLSVDEVLGAVQDERFGGVAVFLGMVRNHDEGRGVRRLDYSAHPSAPEELRRVMTEVAGDADVAVAALHRVGRLGVGEPAVIVAAAAAHRDEAFVVGRRLIDRIKAEVPLWKHQEYDDGEQVWVGACD